MFNQQNIEELHNSDTQTIFLVELKYTELEYNIYPPKKSCINNTASQLLALNFEEEKKEISIECFKIFWIEQFKDLSSSYYWNSQNINELCDILVYWFFGRLLRSEIFWALKYYDRKTPLNRMFRYNLLELIQFC